MTQTNPQTTTMPKVQVGMVKATRLTFVDHLRAALVILVVLHHVALVYGGIQPFYYLEPPASLAGFVVPMIFVLMNQAWFMGAFFLLAGYFTPGSYDHKGSGSFLKDRLIRLGIPLVVWIFVLNPVSEIGFFLMPASLTGITTQLTWRSFWDIYPTMFGLGPLWFVAMLLIFSIGYALWRILNRKQSPSSTRVSSTPGYLGMVVFILGLAIMSYLVRMFIPLGKSIFDFPTLAYLPQYLSFFVIGTIAYRRNWLQTLRGSMGIVGFVIAMVATITLFSVGFLSFLKALENAALQIPPFGFGTWQSALYALWDSIFAVGMSVAAITFFRRFFNGDSRIGRFLSQQSYAVYIIHIPIIIFLAYALRGIEMASLLKLGLASLIVVPTCFILAYIIRKIPGVASVL